MEELNRHEQAIAQYKLLGHEGIGWTEIRVLSKGTSVYVNDAESYARAVLSTHRLDTYVGINPRKSDKGSGANGASTEADVSQITAIVFDLDPIRPKGTASTEEQRQEAIRIAGQLCREVDGVLSTSGSGAHVTIPIVPVVVSNPAGCADSLRAYAKAFQSKYGTDKIRIDSTFDLPRIIRCWGTHNNKSDRECYYLSGQAIRKEHFIDQTERETTGGSMGTTSERSIQVQSNAKFELLVKRNELVAGILGGRGNYVSRSERDFHLAAELLRSGFSQSDIPALLRLNKYGKARERSDRDLQNEVRRVYDLVKDTIPNHSVGLDVSEYERDLSTRSPGIRTGFAKWDSMTAGLKPSRFYVEAGRPTDGKTTRLVQMAVNVARQNKKVLYFPTEVPRSAVYDKMVSAASGVGLRKFQYGDFTAAERGAVSAAAKEVSGLPIVIAEDYSLTLDKVLKSASAVSPDVVIVDFLQYMKYNDPNSSSEMARNVAGLKKIGEDFKIPVILASQLHRKPANVADSLSDLKGTGSLEELGDVVTFIRTVDPVPYPAKSRLTIWKNKYGEPGSIDMEFYRSTCTFKESTDVHAM